MPQIDRVQLYEDVWRMSLKEVAKKLGVSTAAVITACQEHEVPRPSSSDRIAMQRGWSVERPPLPPLTMAAAEAIVLPEPQKSPSPIVTHDEPKTSVPERLTKPHPLVSQAMAAARNPNAAGRRHSLDVSVSRGSLARAMRIMDTLIKTWESDGGEVSVTEPTQYQRSQTQFGTGPDSVTVSMEERYEIEKRPAPADRPWARPEPIRHPTGRLVLRSEGALVSDRLRHQWADGSIQDLERMLDTVIADLRLPVDDRRQLRLNHECEKRQSDRAKAVRARATQKQEYLKQGSEQLEQDLQAWLRSRRIRCYLRHIRRSVQEGALRVTNAEVFEGWMTFGTWYADYIDPHARPGPMPGWQDLQAQNTDVNALDWTSRTRKVIAALGVKDTDSLYRVEKKTVEAADEGRSAGWNEICRVLEGLGYDMAGRQDWLL